MISYKYLSVVLFSAVYALFLKFGIGIDNIQGPGWILVTVIYFGTLGFFQ